MENIAIKKKINISAWWIALILIGVVYFCTTNYGDMVESSSKAINLLDSLFSGNFPGDYTFESAFYIPVHMAFAVWCLPMWALIKAGVLTSSSVPFLLWVKLLVAAAFIGCIWLLKKILEDMECDHVEFWCFITASSLIFFMPAMELGMYDYFELFIGLLALRKVAKEDELSVISLLLLSLSVAVKIFFIFAAVIIVLLKEKRLLHLMKDALICMIFPAIFWLLAMFYNTKATAAPVSKAGLINIMAGRFTSSKIPGGIYALSIFFIFIFISFILAYILPKKNLTKEFLADTAWLVSLAYIALFSFVLSHPQWIVLMVPFIVMLAAYNKSKFKVMVILLTVVDIGIFFLHTVYYYWVYLREGAFMSLLLGNVPVNGGMANFSGLITALGLEGILPIIASLVFATSIVMLVFGNPWKNFSTIRIENERDEKIFIFGMRAYHLIVLILYFVAELIINFVDIF